jgi:predicted acylesterase/phospholipase RssA
MFILLIFFYIRLMNTIKNLVISGGGVKLFTTIGLLQKINLDSVVNYSAVSAGSIISYFLALGYTPNELETICTEIDIHNIMGELSIDHIFKSQSLSTNVHLKAILSTLTNYIIKQDSITFIEHYKLTNKIINIGASNLTTRDFTIFNKDTTPNVYIIDAVLASTSIPGIFPPHKINNNYYCDGFIFNNFPIEIFDNDIKHTLGINFQSDTYDENLNIFKYIWTACTLPSSSVELKQFQKYSNNIIIIKNDNLPLTDFNLTKETIQLLIDYGKNDNNYLNKETFQQLFS